MSFKDRKRDDHGHVISNDEVDGQECQHQSGGAAKQDFLKRNNAASNSPLAEGISKANEDRLNEAFDDDYDEEFNEPSPEDEKQYVDKCMADIAKASDKKAFEYVSDNIDELTEAGLISDETSDRLYNALDRKIDEVNNDIDKDLMDAINMADDDILDEEFGKDTSERKLVGAIKEGKPEDFAKKTAKMPNGKEMSLFDFAHNIVNYLDTDTASTIIASKFGVSEADAKAYLESPYNTEGFKEDYQKKLNASQAMKSPVNKVSMSALPKHHFDKNGHLVIDEGEYKGTYTNEREFWNDVNASNPNVIYKEWDKMTPEEQKDTKINAKNVFDYLNDKYYNDNIKDKPAKADIDLLKKFLGNEKLTNKEFEKMTGLLERYVK